MDTYFPPECIVFAALPAQGLLDASIDTYPIDNVDAGLI